MARLMQWGFFVLLACSLILASSGVASLLGSTRGKDPGPDLVVETPLKSFGAVPRGREVFLSYSLSNRSDHPIRILGVTSLCTPQGCLGVGEQLPFEIPPRSQSQIKLKVQTGNQGNFRADVGLFSDCLGQKTVSLGAEGQVLDRLEY